MLSELCPFVGVSKRFSGLFSCFVHHWRRIVDRNPWKCLGKKHCMCVFVQVTKNTGLNNVSGNFNRAQLLCINPEATVYSSVSQDEC